MARVRRTNKQIERAAELGFDETVIGDGSVTGHKPMHKKAKIELFAEEEKIEAAFRKHAANDFMVFARGLHIDSAFGSRIFDSCMADYQRACFEDMNESLNALKLGEMPPKRRWWLERTKKAGKDSDLAVMVLWLLCFPVRPLYLQVGAANKEQASIVKERMVHLLHYNPWLNELVEIVQWEVRSKVKLADNSPMAKLHIMSSDVGGAHGGTPDLLVVNELSHVSKWEFVENLMDNADGVPQGMVVVATNAGHKGTTCELWRNNAITSSDWTMHVWRFPAPWHAKSTVRDARNRNSRSRFQRLWQGTWTSGKGDALSEYHIECCFTLDGPTPEPEPDWEYLVGLDLGISHDHSAILVLGVNREEQLLKVAYWKAWEPTVVLTNSKKKQVDLIDVERTCRLINRKYRPRLLLYDPSEARLMAQRLHRVGVPVKEMSFQNQKNITSMAINLLQVLNTKKLKAYDKDNRLRRDFGKFNIVEKAYGYKLEAVSDVHGHADVGTALIICLPVAVEMLDSIPGLSDDDDLIYMQEEKLSKEEYEEMPEEFKALYEDMSEQNDDQLEALQDDPDFGDFEL